MKVTAEPLLIAAVVAVESVTTLPAILAMVVPFARPFTKTGMPTARPLVLATVIVVAPLAAAAPKVVAIGALKLAIGAPKIRLLEAWVAVAVTASPVVALTRLTVVPLMLPMTVFCGIPTPWTYMPAARPATSAAEAMVTAPLALVSAPTAVRPTAGVAAK